MGGSDQWGNIVAGTELIRKMRGAKGYGLVFPLVTTSAGIKFGKTEAGSVWLDPKLTSPYRFYQFWINTEDSDVVKYLKFFTMLDQQAIAELEQAVVIAPEKREAQKRLAEEVTRTVHGESNLRKAIQASRVLFGGEIEDLSASDVLDIFAEVPSSEVPGDAFTGDGVSLVDLVISMRFRYIEKRSPTFDRGWRVSTSTIGVYRMFKQLSISQHSSRDSSLFYAKVQGNIT